jgi:hypothetical protein
VYLTTWMLIEIELEGQHCTTYSEISNLSISYISK